MSTAATRSELLAHRFDARLRSLFLIGIGLHVPLILFNAMLDNRVAIAMAHLAMAGMAWIMTKRAGDMVRVIIFSHVYWTFSALTYFYAFANGQSASDGLYRPDRAALIALVSQSGLFLAYLLSPAGPVERSDAPQRSAVLAKAQWPLIAIGALAIAGRMVGLVNNAYAAAMTLVLFMALASRLTERKYPLADPVLILVCAALATVSISLNQRTDLMAPLVLIACAAIMLPKRLFTLGNAAWAYLAWRLLSAFSAVILAVRWARDGSQSLVELFVANFFSLETLWTLINPLHRHAIEELAGREAAIDGFNSAFLQGDTSLFARLALLPQMDIVTSRLEAFHEIRWGDLLDNVLAALPTVGLDKALVFSDQVVWELGLRSRDTLGRPMITVEGELFAIGGYGAVLVIIPLCYFVLYWCYCWLALLTGSRAVAILIASQLFIGTVFSTTLLTVLTDCIRTPIQLIVLLWLLSFLRLPRRAEALA
jgi:hypothetical protein